MSSWDRPVTLIVMDGFGLRDERHGNAIAAADTPHLDELMADYPTVRLPADGEHVGLLPGTLGGSEVGHMQIGAGRLVPQMAAIISNAIDSGDFFDNDTLLDALDHAATHDGRLHVIGLCSDKGVHSHIDHLYGVLRLAARNDFDRICIHMILDGRDTAPQVAERYIREVQEKLETLPGKICTVSGRYYAMDRDERWDRTRRVYDAIIRGNGRTAATPLTALEQAYDRDETDEFVSPTLVQDCQIQDGDAVFIFNFRADRCRQLTRAFLDDDFDPFETEDIENLFVSSMTRYSNDFDNPVAFETDNVEHTLGEVLGDRGMRQYRIAESEKKAHVTYFFSGRNEHPFTGEDRRIYPSPEADLYDKTPEMRAEAITDLGCTAMERGEHDLILVNLSNCDMVGHTGDFEATIEAVETVDRCVGRMVDAAGENGYTVLVTADHGNADEMKDEEDEPLTAHSHSPVPFIAVMEQEIEFHDDPQLYRIAPAILELNGEDLPDAYSEPLFSIGEKEEKREGTSPR